MAKIMLVMDDYAELVTLETLLKRVGFDTLSVNKDSAVSDALLGFLPELVISTLKGRAVDGVKVAAKLKQRSFGGPGPRLAFVASAVQITNVSSEARSKADGFIELPAEPHVALSVIARLLRQDPAPLIEKLDRLTRGSQSSESSVVVVKDRASGEDATTSSGPANANANANASAERPLTARERRYEAFLKANAEEPVNQVVPHEELAKAAKKLREAAESDSESLEAINREKREFVKSMMKKPRGE